MLKQIVEENKNKLNANIVELKGVALEHIYIGAFVSVEIDKYSGSVSVKNLK